MIAIRETGGRGMGCEGDPMASWMLALLGKMGLQSVTFLTTEVELMVCKSLCHHYVLLDAKIGVLDIGRFVKSAKCEVDRSDDEITPFIISLHHLLSSLHGRPYTGSNATSTTMFIGAC